MRLPHRPQRPLRNAGLLSEDQLIQQVSIEIKARGACKGSVGLCGVRAKEQNPIPGVTPQMFPLTGEEHLMLTQESGQFLTPRLKEALPGLLFTPLLNSQERHVRVQTNRKGGR